MDKLQERIEETVAWLTAISIHGDDDALAKLIRDMQTRIDELEKAKLDKQQDLNFMWRWIERGVFDKNTTAEGALSVLSYYDSAPWYSDRKAWDTSHKDYDAAINERITDRERIKQLEEESAKLREAGLAFTEKDIKEIRATIRAMRLQNKRDGKWESWWLKFLETSVELILPQTLNKD